MSAQTLFEKIWSRHRIFERDDGQTLLYVDRHLIHDVTAPAFEMLRGRRLTPRVPARAIASPDHYVPTANRDLATVRDPEMRTMAQAVIDDATRAGILAFGLDDARQGISHVVAPEQGISQPGRLIVCGDSHTSTHGALGALAFGIGTTEVAHVLAAVLDEPGELGLARDAVARARHLADLSAPGALRRLAGLDDVEAPRAQRGRGAPQLRRLPAPVDAFEDDERPAVHVASETWRRHPKRTRAPRGLAIR